MYRAAFNTESSYQNSFNHSFTNKEILNQVMRETIP